MNRIQQIFQRDRGLWISTLTASHMAFNTTIRCQQHCVYCFEGERDGKSDMDPEVARAVLREISETCGGVVFMGAEPTMNPHIVDLISYATEIGLKASISTNALKFKSAKYLDRCFDAGCRTWELSFAYPDAGVYSQITSLNEKAYSSLLQALENINTLCKHRDGDISPEDWVEVNANCVVSKFNFRRLREVLDKLQEHLSDTRFLVTMKMLGPTTESEKSIDIFLREHYVPLRTLRECFSELLDDWPYDFPVIFRGYPLCVIPGFEDLAANLYYHMDGADSHVVLGNIESDQKAIRRMHTLEVDVPRNVARRECLECTLEPICLDRRLLYFDEDDPASKPIPSDRRSEDVLCAFGMDETVARILLSQPLKYVQH